MLHKQKKTKVYILMSVVTCLVFCGCQKEEEKNESVIPQYTMDELRDEASQLKQKYSNMDFSKTNIIIPEVNEIEELIFPLDLNISESEDTYKKIKDNFYENIKQLTGRNDINEKYIYYKLPLDEEPIHIYDVKEEDRERSAYSESDESGQGFYLSYNDSVYSMLLYGSSFMLEVANNRVSDYSEKGYDWLGHRPPEGNVVESFDLPEDSIENISYSIDGKMLALKKAVAYVEENMGKGYHYIRSPFLSYQVCHVDVIKLEENSYYYQMNVRALYQGISFSYETNANILPVNEQEVDYENVSTTHIAVVMSEDSIDYIWSCAHSYETKKEGEVYNKFISVKDAMDILSSTVSAATKLECDTVELMYRTEFHKNEFGDIEEVQCHPVYQFKFTNTGLPEYPVLFFNVDAISGLVEASNA
ncbi:MAG: hypothetical protein LUH14_07980 [Clostridiaceae bacterium]|nr:hypothetical protein [Clostridiaceae bacterium]